MPVPADAERRMVGCLAKFGNFGYILADYVHFKQDLIYDYH